MNDQLIHIDINDSLLLALLGGPLLVFLSLILLGRKITKFRGIFATIITFILLTISIYLFASIWGSPGESQGLHIAPFPWFKLSSLSIIDFNLHLDGISSLFVLIVMITTFFVHLFSIEYLRGDDHFEKYFAYLALFVFSILGIILSENLFVVFVFWELVGFSSYLLVGFYFWKKEAAHANKKAFIVNRIGDIGFIIALLTIYSCFGTWNIDSLLNIYQEGNAAYFNPEFLQKYDLTTTNLTLIGLGILSGAIAKSAQFPLNVWLPNAMEGPTPVSALIHAATMVAAGVYLIIRTGFLFTPDVMNVIAIIGSITAFMGAFAAMAQTDIKRVLAFSTISQLGYMFIALGIGDSTTALLHLMTHAFFKACLFLGAGAIIYSLHKVEKRNNLHFDAQNMKNMGGMKTHMPLVYIAYLISASALIGLPFTSGFLSKETIMVAIMNWVIEQSTYMYIVPVLAFISVGLTGFYMTRQVILVFFGENRLHKNSELGEGQLKIDRAPLLMTIPIVSLAALSLFIAYSFNPVNMHDSWFYNIASTMSIISSAQLAPNITEASASPLLVTIGTLSFAVSGIIYAFSTYKKHASLHVLNDEKGLFGTKSFLYKLSYNNWYLDKIYSLLFVSPTLMIGYFTVFIDKVILGNLILGIKELVLLKAKIAKYIDLKILSPIIDLFGYINVIFAHIIRFIDKYIIDGLVMLVVHFTGRVGRFSKSLQIGATQEFITVALVGFVSLIVGAIYLIFN
ncbi:NADH-quinone oxidoreductase subunit L [Cyclobacteriaceae bacterium]|nr:NADH-quinone oxidoreductase subunit L [Cyclobacteriaceae bacterium]